MICECGNNRFYATQYIESMEAVIVDEDGDWREDVDRDKHPDASGIVDYRHPEGPYICTKCGKTYDEDWEEVGDNEDD